MLVQGFGDGLQSESKGPANDDGLLPHNVAKEVEPAGRCPVVVGMSLLRGVVGGLERRDLSGRPVDHLRYFTVRVETLLHVLYVLDPFADDLRLLGLGERVSDEGRERPLSVLHVTAPDVEDQRLTSPAGNL